MIHDPTIIIRYFPLDGKISYVTGLLNKFEFVEFSLENGAYLNFCSLLRDIFAAK